MTRFITVNLIFTIYLSILATCQELVDLGQTAFKSMLIAFWSLALPKHIAKLFIREKILCGVFHPPSNFNVCEHGN